MWIFYYEISDSLIWKVTAQLPPRYGEQILVRFTRNATAWRTSCAARALVDRRPRRTEESNFRNTNKQNSRHGYNRSLFENQRIFRYTHVLLYSRFGTDDLEFIVTHASRGKNFPGKRSQARVFYSLMYVGSWQCCKPPLFLWINISGNFQKWLLICNISLQLLLRDVQNFIIIVVNKFILNNFQDAFPRKIHYFVHPLFLNNS